MTSAIRQCRIKLVTTQNICTLIFSLILFSYGQKTIAQEIISSNGGSYTNSSVQLAWSIGEPVTETFISGSNTLTQGFQQSNLTVTAINLVAQNGITINVYPNPVSDVLIIGIVTDVFKNINFRLFDISGKLLMQKKMEHITEILNMQVFRSGNYLLEVYSETWIPLQSFKVVKNLSI
jgi:hypothetical protein